jgi:hypothetical protein
MEQLIEEYFKRNTNALNIWKKNMTGYNFQRIGAFSRLVENILEDINTYIKSNISNETDHNKFSRFLISFKEKCNNYCMSEDLHLKINNLKSVSDDTNKIISEHLNALNHLDQQNRKFISYYFRKQFIDVYFKSHDYKNDHIFSDINIMLVESEIKGLMAYPYDKLESIIFKSNPESYDKFIKLFLNSYDKVDQITEPVTGPIAELITEPKIKSAVEPTNTTELNITKNVIKEPNTKKALPELSELLKLRRIRPNTVLYDGISINLREEKEKIREKKKQEKLANNPKRTVTMAQKKFIAGRQFNKCANRPEANLKGFETYECPLWQRADEHRGCFDQSGYDIDHIVEFAISHDDTNDNLQALCKSCHSMKTKKFAMRKREIKKEIKKDSDV